MSVRVFSAHLCVKPPDPIAISEYLGVQAARRKAELPISVRESALAVHSFGWSDRKTSA